MIDYKLAIALKEAGFPQKGDGKWYANVIGDGGKDGNGYWKIYDYYGDIYIPTLSELIEYLGSEFLQFNQKIIKICS